MGKRYCIWTSRKDVGLVSYCPGLEIKGDPDGNWIDGVLTPAVEPLTKRKSTRIWNLPITFWCSVRGTARRRAEIFVFTTPAYPGAAVEQALRKALGTIQDCNIHAAREPIPENAVPCLQIFRGRIIRFYMRLEGHEGFYLPLIQWRDSGPALVALKFPEDHELLNIDAPIEEMGRFLAEAQTSPVSDGDSCRRFQQALTAVALKCE